MKKTICAVIITAILISACGQVANDQEPTEDLVKLQEKADELEKRLDEINKELDALEVDNIGSDTGFTKETFDQNDEQELIKDESDGATDEENPYAAYFEKAGIVGTTILEEDGVKIVFEGITPDNRNLQLSVVNNNPDNKRVYVRFLGVTYNGLNCFLPDEFRELIMVNDSNSDNSGVSVCGKNEFVYDYDIVDAYSGGVTSGDTKIVNYLNSKLPSYELDELLKCLSIDSLDEFPLYKMGFVFSFDMANVGRQYMVEWTSPDFSRSKMESLYGEDKGVASINGNEVRVFAKTDNEYVHTIVLINDGNPFSCKREYSISGEDIFSGSNIGFGKNVGYNKYMYPSGGYAFSFSETVDQIKRVLEIPPSDDFSFYVDGNLVYTYK